MPSGRRDPLILTSGPLRPRAAQGRGARQVELAAKPGWPPLCASLGTSYTLSAWTSSLRRGVSAGAAPRGVWVAAGRPEPELESMRVPLRRLQHPALRSAPACPPQDPGFSSRPAELTPGGPQPQPGDTDCTRGQPVCWAPGAGRERETGRDTHPGPPRLPPQAPPPAASSPAWEEHT